jgi:hypothetical protein
LAAIDLELMRGGECKFAVEIGTHEPERTFGRVVPISKMVPKILLAIALKVTVIDIIVRDGGFYSQMKCRTSFGRGVLDI